MAELSNKDLQALQADMEALQGRFKTLLLSTVSPQGEPEISYTPFARDALGGFYIYISELAAHTGNLLENSRVSVMLIQDEQATRNLYARERLTWHCRARLVAVDDPEWELGLGLLEEAQGKMIAMLRTLADFRLFYLRPERGSYVVGFGRAYDVDPVSGLLLHVDEAVLDARKG